VKIHMQTHFGSCFQNLDRVLFLEHTPLKEDVDRLRRDLTSVAELLHRGK
jgi:hypothetical protein